MERRVSVRELNQRTSAVLNEVASGHAVTITSDGEPVARLMPISSTSATLDNLVRTGRAVAPSIVGQVAMPPAYDDERIDVASAMQADRADERW